VIRTAGGYAGADALIRPYETLGSFVLGGGQGKQSLALIQKRVGMKKRAGAVIIQQLHNAVCAYCQQRMKRPDVYEPAPGGVSTLKPGISDDVLLDAICRLGFMNAVRWEVDAIIPGQLASQADLNKALLAIADKCLKWAAREGESQAVKDSIADEYNAFVKYFQTLTVEQAGQIGPLPHRRTLSDQEHVEWLGRISAKWGIQIDGGWLGDSDYPFADGNLQTGRSLPLPVAAFDPTDVLAAQLEAPIRAALQARGSGYLFRFEQNYHGIECDVSGMDFERAQYRIISVTFDPSLEWIIYTSQQDFMTFGGWALDQLKQHWPTWSDHVFEAVEDSAESPNIRGFRVPKTRSGSNWG
jgi:hypothetical protein